MRQNTLKFGNLNIYILPASRTADRGPEPTNAPYGIAKKAIFVMIEAYYRQYGMKNAVLVPVNLFGPGGNFDPETSHMIPALIRKCEEARIRSDKEIVCWGTGKATHEFCASKTPTRESSVPRR